jgi:hypothetical protein
MQLPVSLSVYFTFCRSLSFLVGVHQPLVTEPQHRPIEFEFEFEFAVHGSQEGRFSYFVHVSGVSSDKGCVLLVMGWCVAWSVPHCRSVAHGGVAGCLTGLGPWGTQILCSYCTAADTCG